MTLIFVSYSPDAIDFANKVKERLIHHGFEVFTESASKVQTGWDRIEEMNLSKCDIFLVILTPVSLESKEVEKEVLYALNKKKLIIPCTYRKLVDKNHLKWGLNKIQGIEFSDKLELVKELDAKFTYKENKMLDDNKPQSPTPARTPTSSPVISRPTQSEKQSTAPARTPTPETPKPLNLKIIMPIVSAVAAISIIVLAFSGLLSTDRSIPTELTSTDVQTPLDYIREWHSSQPVSVAITTLDNVYTYGPEGVEVTESNGDFITSWPSPSKPASFSSTGQGSIAVDSSDNVYVADAGNNRIQKFDSEGNLITMWGSRGNGEGKFESPRRIAVDSSDNVYVADAGNNRIQKFDSNGNLITMWRLNNTGEEFGLLSGIAVDSSDNVYVAETERSIQKFDSNGRFVDTWDYLQEGERRDKYPDPIIGIAVDSSDNVYVADSENDRIQKFDSNGVLKSSWGSEGEGQGEFNSPQGIALDSSGNVYVADSWNNRVQVFSQ